MELSTWEKITYDRIVEAAEHGLRAPTCDDLVDALGCRAVATTVNAVKRLEHRGLIRVERFQRERRITVLATGKATAPVKNKTPMWRLTKRPRDVPSVGVDMLRHRKPELVREMMVAARHEGMSLQDFLIECVWTGWQVREELGFGGEK